MELRIPEREHSTRRDWIGAVVLTAGAGMFAHPLLAQVEANTSWKPIFLNGAQNERLVVLGDCIIPGAKDALCNRIIDLVLSVDSEKNKADFTHALAAFDAAAQSQYRKPLANLQPAELTQLLTGASSFGDPLWPEFQLLKEWLADSYWSSKQGLGELGWTGRIAWDKFDGCAHGGSHG
jgi:Gluconate 2-dehydrogenase subunit 3